MSSPDQHADIELVTIASSSAYRQGPSAWGDSEPLLPRPSTSTARSPRDDKHSEDSLSGIALRWLFSRLLPTRLQRRCTFAMARFRNSKAARLLSKLQTTSEPGLTNAQLMLTNHALKPVEPDRRIWGPWNYVGTGLLLSMFPTHVQTTR